jgi:single stranded DNA-binding protein
MRQIIVAGKMASALSIKTATRTEGKGKTKKEITQTWGEFLFEMPAVGDADNLIPYQFNVYVAESMIPVMQTYSDRFQSELEAQADAATEPVNSDEVELDPQVFIIVAGTLNAIKTETDDGRKITEYTIRANRVSPSSVDVRVNQVTLVGRLGADPELRIFDSGSKKVELSLAINTAKNQPPQWFNRVDFWGNQAETIATYAQKGQQLMVQGYFRPSYFTNNDGLDVVLLGFNCDQFQFGQKANTNGRSADAEPVDAIPAGMMDDMPAGFGEI